MIDPAGIPAAGIILLAVADDISVPLLAGAKKYEISRSLRFNSADSAYLSRTSGTSTNQTKATFSFWMKASPSLLTGAQYAIWCNTSNAGMIAWNISSYGGDIFVRTDSANDVRFSLKFRDPGAWQHIVVSVDTSDATGSNRVKLYVNSIQQTSTSGTPNQNSTSFNASSTVYNIGRDIVNGTYFAGYLTEINFVDGQALTPSSFGETDPVTGVWIPKRYTGTYGTNGFYLSFANNASTTTLGYDDAGGIAGSGAGCRGAVAGAVADVAARPDARAVGSAIGDGAVESGQVV